MGMVFNKSENASRALFKKGFYATVAKVLGAVAVFLINLILARSLGVEDFGTFTLSLTVISVMAVFARLGFDTFLIRELSSTKNAAKDGYAAAISRSMIFLLFILSTVLFLSVSLFEQNLSSFELITEQTARVLSFMSPLYYFLIVGWVVADGFKALGFAPEGIFVQNALVPLLFLFALFFLPDYFFSGAEEAAFLYGLLGLVALLYALFRWQMLISPSSAVSTNLNLTAIFKASFPLLLVSSGGLVMSWTDILVLGMYESEHSIGIYTVASKISFLISLILVAVNSIAAPRFSMLYSSGDHAALRIFVNQVTIITFTISALPTSVVILFPEILLESLFGLEYRDAAKLLIILAFGQFVNAACGSVGYLLIMAKRELLVRNIIWSVAILNVLSSVILVKLYGVVGVAYATAISYVVWNFILVWSVRQILGFWMLDFRKFFILFK